MVSPDAYGKAAGIANPAQLTISGWSDSSSATPKRIRQPVVAIRDRERGLIIVAFHLRAIELVIGEDGREPNTTVREETSLSNCKQVSVLVVVIVDSPILGIGGVFFLVPDTANAGHGRSRSRKKRYSRSSWPGIFSRVAGRASCNWWVSVCEPPPLRLNHRICACCIVPQEGNRCLRTIRTTPVVVSYQTDAQSAN